MAHLETDWAGDRLSGPPFLAGLFSLQSFAG
jgi:hypothetical protein